MKPGVRFARLALLLLVSGCVSGTGSFCPQDVPIEPSNADIDVMSDELAMRIDAHDEHYGEQCE
jgi:hypothetical protein